MEDAAREAGELRWRVSAARVEGDGVAGLQVIRHLVVGLRTALAVLAQVVVGSTAGVAGEQRLVSGLQARVALREAGRLTLTPGGVGRRRGRTLPVLVLGGRRDSLHLSHGRRLGRKGGTADVGHPVPV